MLEINKLNWEAVKKHNWENEKPLTPPEWQKLYEEAGRMRKRLQDAGIPLPDLAGKTFDDPTLQS